MEEYQQGDPAIEQALDPTEQIEPLESEDINERKEDEQFLSEEGLNSDNNSGIIGYSEPKPIGGLYALFQDVLDRASTTKVSNLDKTELGNLDITVRDAMKIGLIAKTFHHPSFANFFFNQAEITTSSSMAKKGWFTELFVTSKKFAQRDTSQSLNLPQQSNKKWSLFGKNQQPVT